jgi:hypothetical protein
MSQDRSQIVAGNQAGKKRSGIVAAICAQVSPDTVVEFVRRDSVKGTRIKGHKIELPSRHSVETDTRSFGSAAEILSAATPKPLQP